MKHLFEYIFSLTAQRNLGSRLALFTRLNRQGLLEGIERKQAYLASSLSIIP